MTFNFDTVFNDLNRPLFYTNPGFKVLNKSTNKRYTTALYMISLGQPNFSRSNLLYDEKSFLVYNGCHF